jgi:Lambda phage tail tube protein, TTP
MADGLVAQGSYLLIETATPGSFVEIAEVTNISGGGGTTERIDFTHLRSPGRRREYKPSFIESGVLTWTVQYIPTDASHIRLLALLDSGTEVPMREVFVDGSGWDYVGYMSGVEKTGQDVGGKVQLNCSYQITGAIDFTGVGAPAATGATAGSPGTYTPSGAALPANLAAMTGITATPATAWTSGQFVYMADGNKAHWSATAWVAGEA